MVPLSERRHRLYNHEIPEAIWERVRGSSRSFPVGLRKGTPSHSLFTHFRHRLGEYTYLKIFDYLLRRLLESGAVKGARCVLAIETAPPPPSRPIARTI